MRPPSAQEQWSEFTSVYSLSRLVVTSRRQSPRSDACRLTNHTTNQKRGDGARLVSHHDKRRRLRGKARGITQTRLCPGNHITAVLVIFLFENLKDQFIKITKNMLVTLASSAGLSSRAESFDFMCPGLKISAAKQTLAMSHNCSTFTAQLIEIAKCNV